MPELPEVERAAKLLKGIAKNNEVVDVQASEDTIVYSGTTHQEFVQTVKGRVVRDVGRYGKVFYMELEGDGKMPVMHFGMTGMLQVKGQLATFYRETPRKASADWPPRFMKFILHIKDRTTGEIAQVAFLDARRLGRIRLCTSPRDEPPISALGFDPILCMPELEEFESLVLKRSCPIKALLLDQSFSAGVGNWVADEVLYHSRIHPERRCNTLTKNELAALHRQIQQVCKIAVDANADDSKFPENWLFKHRWGKGKKKHTLLLPSGEPASIKWVTVGGRTSAFVAQLQHFGGSGGSAQRGKGTARASREKDEAEAEDEQAGDESELTSIGSEDEGTEADAKAESTSSRKRKAPSVERTRSARRETEDAVNIGSGRALRRKR